MGSDPPLTGVAVKVTAAPGQDGFAVAAMLTLTGRTVFTLIAMVLEVAGLPVGQGSLEIRLQDTRSLLDGV